MLPAVLECSKENERFELRNCVDIECLGRENVYKDINFENKLKIKVSPQKVTSKSLNRFNCLQPKKKHVNKTW